MAYKIPNQLMNMTGADYVNALKFNKQNEGLPIFGNGIVGNLVGGAGSAFLGGLGDTAQFVGATGLGNLLNAGANEIEEHLKPAKNAEFSWDYLTSPEGLARGLGNLGGSIASIVAPTLLVPGGGLVEQVTKHRNGYSKRNGSRSDDRANGSGNGGRKL